MADSPSTGYPPAIPYAVLQRSHEDYDCQYWEQLEALYCGGKALLRDPIFKSIFPPHLNEADFVYRERVARAFYINYAGEIIDHIVSALMMHPVQAASTEKHDKFYDSFFDNVSYSGLNKISLQNLIRKQITNALIYGTAWTLVDFPPMIEPLGEEISSEGEQIATGQLNAYALVLDPEIVLDWEEGPDGALLWAKTCVLKKEKDFSAVSDLVVEEYTIYRPSDWARYSIRYKQDKKPAADTPVELIDSGEHSFGKVPLLRLKLPDALWAMNKLESLAREHLNKRCALSWAEFKTLYQQLYEFEGGEDEAACGEGVVSDDAGRFVNQTRGPGYIQVRAGKDRAEFIGPSSAPFAHALDSLKDLRDEMHRITHQMALSFDNQALALRRSGDSKAQDKKDSTVILNALGQIAREHVYDIYSTITFGRRDSLSWVITGLDEYDDVDITALLNQAVLVNTVDIPSPMFKAQYRASIVKAVLGEKLTVEDLNSILAEIEEAYKNEKPQTLEQPADASSGQQALGNVFNKPQVKTAEQAQKGSK